MVVEHPYDENHKDGQQRPDVLEHKIKVETGQYNGGCQKESDTCAAGGMVDMGTSLVGDVNQPQLRRILPYQTDQEPGEKKRQQELYDNRHTTAPPRFCSQVYYTIQK